MQIRVRGASLTYGAVTVFTNLDIDIAGDQVTAIVGPSGSGKTSILSAMAGYQSLSAGTIQVRASGASRWTPPRPQGISWVPQGSNALGGRSVLDNVMVGGLGAGLSLIIAREEAFSHLERVGLRDVSDQPARTLSGGELQRLALARGLASRPQALFADEPSANLDLANTVHIAEILRQLARTATVVVTTHDPLIIDAAENVVEIRRAALAE